MATSTWMITSVSSRLKLGFFLLVLGFALAAGASLWSDFSHYIESKALGITAAVCLIIAITAAGIGVHLDEARGHPVPKVLAGLFGLLGCIFYIAAASLKINWNNNRDADHYRQRTNVHIQDSKYIPGEYDYPCALVILGAIFGLVGAIFCLLDLAKVRLGKTDDPNARSGEVRVHRMKDTDGDGRVDKVDTKTYTVNE